VLVLHDRGVNGVFRAQGGATALRLVADRIPRYSSGNLVISERIAMSMSNAKLVTIYGGSGFVGRYIARRMAK
jgi:hypothetical protein